MLSNNVRRNSSNRSNRSTVKPKQTGKPPKQTGHARVKKGFNNVMGRITDANKQFEKGKEKVINKLNKTKPGREVVKVGTDIWGALTGDREGPQGMLPGKRKSATKPRRENVLRPGHRTWTYAE